MSEILYPLNRREKWLVRYLSSGFIWVSLLFLSGLLGCLAMGCSLDSTARNKGAYYLEWGTRVEVGHEASKTCDEDATVGIEIQVPMLEKIAPESGPE